MVGIDGSCIYKGSVVLCMVYDSVFVGSAETGNHIMGKTLFTSSTPKRIFISRSWITMCWERENACHLILANAILNTAGEEACLHRIGKNLKPKAAILPPSQKW